MMTRICRLVTDRMTSHDHHGHPRRHATLVILVITRKGDHGHDRPGWPAGERPPYSPFDLAGRPTGSRVAADELSADVSTGSVRWVRAHLPRALRSLSDKEADPVSSRVRSLTGHQALTVALDGAGCRSQVRPTHARRARPRSALGSANFRLFLGSVGEHRGPHRAARVRRPGLISSYKISLSRGWADAAA